MAARAGCCIVRFLHLPGLERFSNSRGVFGIVQGGFFLRKKPLSSGDFLLQQLENRYS